jgi:hypothetical protein
MSRNKYQEQTPESRPPTPLSIALRIVAEPDKAKRGQILNDAPVEWRELTKETVRELWRKGNRPRK